VPSCTFIFGATFFDRAFSNIRGMLETEMAKIIENYGRTVSGNLYFNDGLAREKKNNSYADID